MHKQSNEENKQDHKVHAIICANALGTATEMSSFFLDLEIVYTSLCGGQRIKNLICKRAELLDKMYEEQKNCLVQESQIQQKPLKRTGRKNEVAIEDTENDEHSLDDVFLLICKANFNSPGAWEVIGELNPLSQMREYIKERHIRKKDKSFAWEQERKKGELEIEKAELENESIAISNTALLLDIELKQMELIKKQVNQLKALKIGDDEIGDFISRHYAPLLKLDAHIEAGRITEIRLDDDLLSESEQDN